MRVAGNGFLVWWKERRPGASRGAFFYVMVAGALLAAMGAPRADVAPPASPPVVTVTPLDDAVRLSWPRQLDSEMVASGVPDEGLDRWGGASTPLVSGAYEDACDQDFVLQLLRSPLTEGRVVFFWEETPPDSTPRSGQVEILRSGNMYDMTAGIQVGLGPSTSIVTNGTVIVPSASLPPDTLVANWTGTEPGDSGIWFRQNEQGAFRFTAPSSGTVLPGSTNPPGGITLDWEFHLAGSDSAARSGSVVITKADTLFSVFFDSVRVFPPGIVPARATRVGLRAGPVTAGQSFVLRVTPSVIAADNEDIFIAGGRAVEGYAIWRSEVIDLDRPIYVGKIHRCGAPPESAAFFDQPILDYIDPEAHNGYPYYYAVTTSDAEIDSISQPLWDTLKQKVYPRVVSYDSTYTHGESPFADASRARAVPNPYKLSEVWEEGDSKLQFINLPPQSTVYVYTESGDYVTSIRQEDTRSDRVDWDLRNGTGRQVVSGIYIFKVESPHGDKTGRFVVIR